MFQLLFGQKGALRETKKMIGLFLGLTVPLFLSRIYFMSLQTFVLRLEEVLNIFCMVYDGLIFLLALLVVVKSN